MMKSSYPFRLATTSFIFPAGYAENTRRLAPFFDEIELLLFESAADSLPSVGEVEKLRRLAEEHGITYNVHWPIDIDLGAVNPEQRRVAVDALERAAERLQPLAATAYILHLAYTSLDRSPAAVKTWQARSCRSLERLLAQITVPHHRVCIETLDYPPQWLQPVFKEFDISLCLDIGHLVRGNFNPQEVLSAYRQRTRMLHLHGVENGKDHRPLDRLPADLLRLLGRELRDFKETVTLEVFSFADLQLSLKCLADVAKAGAFSSSAPAHLL